MKNQTDTGLERKGKPGFKLTKLGWIPEEWNLYRMNFLFREMRLGGNYPNSTTVSPFPLIKMGNLGRGKMITNKLEYIPNNIEKNEHDKLRFNDLLFNTRNTLDLVGKVAIWFDELPLAYYNSNLLRLFFKKELVHSNVFMNYLFNSHYVLKQIRSFATGTTSVAAFYSRDFKLIRVALPPLPEQQKIARILSIWDKAIEKTEQLIQAKTQLKKGLMQQLLTGKKRLPGYKSNWEKFTVDKIFNFIKTYSYTRDDLIVSGDIHYIHYGDIHTKFHNERLDLSQEKSLPYVETNLISLALLHDNDIVMADVSEDYDGTGKCIELYNVGILKIIAGLHTIALRRKSSKIAQGYGPYLFMNPLVKRELCKIATGISVYGIAKTNLGNIELFVPSLEEQEKITLIFNDLLKEISLLQMQLDRLKKQKAGLMQKLLTGEVKV